MKELNIEETKNFYNRVLNVWANDSWHVYSKKIINEYISKKKNVFSNTIVLNAGSGGNDYDISCKKMYHVDIAENKIKHLNNAVVANVEKLPFENNFFDNIICVGSVINYCDSFRAISELSRVLKPSGHLILEFESSWGFEYINKDEYKKDATITVVDYCNEPHTQWLYSPKYIFKILESYNLKILNKYPYHIISGLISKVLDDKISIKITHIDKYINMLPYIKMHGNNIIMFCCKK